MKLPAFLQSCWQTLSADTLFRRLFGLAFAAVLVSHLATFLLLFGVLGDALHPPPPPPPLPGLPHPHGSLVHSLHGPLAGLLTGMGLQILILGVASWLISRSLARPMQRLAKAAKHFSAQKGMVTVAEEGPAEARETAIVFNQMQLRIERQQAERERFLAAVSHDLRTPLTRIRLRVEQAEQMPDAAKLLEDVEEMRYMLDATLDYLRGSSAPLQMLDIQALTETIADNMQDEGKQVSLQGSAAPILAMPGELRRCLVNLTENAVFYGGRADITLTDAPEQLRICIRDEGPGIPEQELSMVFQPFYRVAASRNRHSGGSGLGLSIALEIARRHGGSLTLYNHHQPHGLVAELVLPRQLTHAA